MDLGFILTRNLTEIRLTGFLYHGTIVRKNQPEVSKNVVSISSVLTVRCFKFTNGLFYHILQIFQSCFEMIKRCKKK